MPNTVSDLDASILRRLVRSIAEKGKHTVALGSAESDALFRILPPLSPAKPKPPRRWAVRVSYPEPHLIERDVFVLGGTVQQARANALDSARWFESGEKRLCQPLGIGGDVTIDDRPEYAPRLIDDNEGPMPMPEFLKSATAEETANGKG